MPVSTKRPRRPGDLEWPFRTLMAFHLKPALRIREFLLPFTLACFEPAGRDLRRVPR